MNGCFFSLMLEARKRAVPTRVAERQDVYAPFFDQVRLASKRALMLDYDGTLAPFTPDRTRAFPYREIPELVGRIMQRNTRVVLISGRAATELLFLSGIHPHPEIWGSHGSERLYPDGTYETTAPPAKQRAGLQLADKSLLSVGLEPRMETKPGGIAVHWRGLSATERTAIEEKVRRISAPLTHDYDLQLLPFDGGLELRAPGKTKGDAVSAILAEVGKSAAAAYLGDDQTDENAFRAIKGRGLAVLVRSEPRPSLADVWLRPPDELGGFLRDWLAACGAQK
ncbi:MAG TPA: trehalose-phosphatase [Terriglobales bacterium]|nr:trehalose-phosphatase [Terriglobales bacterium]